MRYSFFYKYKFLQIAVLFLLCFGNANAGPCDITITAALHTTQLDCDDNDILSISSNTTKQFNNDDVVDAQDTDGVTIVNNGIIQNDGNDFQAPINGTSTRNLTVTNNGTINAAKRYGIYIENAEQVTITNNAGATIRTTYIPGTASAERGAIYGDKIGNCDDGDCYNSSDSNEGAGLTLHNYGTISSRYRTVAGGIDSNAAKSRNVKIYNYDGGSITADTTAALKFRDVEDFALYNYSGATLESGTEDASNGDFVVDVARGHDVVIDNDGTIKSGKMYAVNCDECENFTLDNSGVLEATSNTVYARNLTGTNSITNSGTIKNTSGSRPLQIKQSSGLTLTNTGTIESVTQVAVDLVGSVNPTVINKGTIKSTVNKAKVIDFAQISGGAGTGGTLENYGTIINSTGSSGQSIRLGDGDGAWNHMKIINSGTISSVGESILVSGGSGTVGLDIRTKGEGTWIGEIDMEDAAVTMTLDCSISKDQDIEIEDKTNMIIVNELCGNDTYAILDSSKNPDADNSETNGYLRIYGEDLDIDSHNKKYRTEIFISSLDKVFNSVNDIKEKSIFYAEQKRNNIYSNSIEGISGYFNKDDPKQRKINTYLSYFSQNTNFNNSESLRSENLGFGYQTKNNNENLTFKSLIGISSNKNQDVETETNEIKTKNFIGQFAALNSNYKRIKKIDKKNELTLNVSSIYGVHRLPKYLSNFTDGDLSVDTAIDQVFSAGFDVEYSTTNKNGFILKPYLGLSYNNTFSNDINIIADGENKEAGHVMNGVMAKKIGLSISKNNNNFGFNINLEHKNQDGLIDNNLNLSISKKLQNIAKIRKQSEKADPDLEKLFDQLQLAKENERLAKLAGATIEENKVMKELIIELIKENQKLKTENRIFKKIN